MYREAEAWGQCVFFCVLCVRGMGQELWTVAVLTDLFRGLGGGGERGRLRLFVSSAPVGFARVPSVRDPTHRSIHPSIPSSLTSFRLPALRAKYLINNQTFADRLASETFKKNQIFAGRLAAELRRVGK